MNKKWKARRSAGKGSIMNKKGMEMWQLVFLILALLLFFFALAWYGGLNTQLGEIFAKWNEVF